MVLFSLDRPLLIVGLTESPLRHVLAQVQRTFGLVEQAGKGQEAMPAD